MGLIVEMEVQMVEPHLAAARIELIGVHRRSETSWMCELGIRNHLLALLMFKMPGGSQIDLSGPQIHE
jgi:hypothetical protein